MNNPKEKSTVENYFNEQVPETRRALHEIRKCILEIVPHATEQLNYNIPAYSLVKGGKREQQVMVAGYKNHIGFYPHPTTMAHFDKELSSYKRGKGSVQFPHNKPLPIDLIKRMVAYRLEIINS